MELERSLDIDVQQRDLLSCLNLLDLGLGRSIHVTVNFRPFNELIVVDHLLELLFLDKVVIDSVDFTFPWSSRGA